MGRTTIDRLIVNSPYKKPARHWRYDRKSRLFDLAEGRRPAGYIIASQDSRAFDDPGTFVEIPLVNRIRARVKDWRNEGHPGVSGVTRRLLEYWTDREEFENRRFFFCQLEAIETLIWVTEAADAEKIGLDIPSDGGAFRRLCAKMATGAGKTIVMAMVAAWHISTRSPTRGTHGFPIRPNSETAQQGTLGISMANGTDAGHRHFVLEGAALAGAFRRGPSCVPPGHYDALGIDSVPG